LKRTEPVNAELVLPVDGGDDDDDTVSGSRMLGGVAVVDAELV